MKTLSIDIETYSDVPLQKTGVYRYVESPNFEILLFDYSADSQPVRVIDLACGEQIPKEVLLALEDESVIKWAFHAAFERICLSRFLGYPTGEYWKPESWRCSIIWAATMGLPLSLEGVGAVLGLEKQKLSEGKNLIKYFCQPCTPTKTNGTAYKESSLPCSGQIIQALLSTMTDEFYSYKNGALVFTQKAPLLFIYLNL